MDKRALHGIAGLDLWVCRRTCVPGRVHPTPPTYRCRSGSEGAAAVAAVVEASVPASKSTTSSTVGRRSSRAAPPAWLAAAPGAVVDDNPHGAEEGAVAAGVFVVVAVCAAAPSPFMVGGAAGAGGGVGTLSLAMAAQLENCFCAEYQKMKWYEKHIRPNPLSPTLDDQDLTLSLRHWTMT